MKNVILLLLLVASTLTITAQDVYITRNAYVKFFSNGIIEDITADTETAMSAVDLKNNTVYFKISIASFHFENSLMQDHFNENYMETESFPYAEYNGKIDGKVKLKKGETVEVMVNGEMDIHGVKHSRTDKATITLNEDGTITAEAKFIVKLVDHDVDIPKLLIKNIAEEVEVTLKGTYAKK